MANVVVHDSPSQPFGVAYPLLSIALVGVGIGVFYFLANWLLQNYVTDQIFCRTSNFIQACSDSSVFSANIAIVLSGVLATFLLVWVKSDRPLLVAVATVISLWGFGNWTEGLGWIESLGWSSLIFGLCYLLYSWICRYKTWSLSLVAIAISVLLIRIVLLI